MPYTYSTPEPVARTTNNNTSAYEAMPELLAKDRNSGFPFRSYHAPYVPHAPYRNVYNPVAKRVW